MKIEEVRAVNVVLTYKEAEALAEILAFVVNAPEVISDKAQILATALYDQLRDFV